VVFLSHSCIKTIFLPRQARDKHRENSKADRFLAGEDGLGILPHRCDRDRQVFLSHFDIDRQIIISSRQAQDKQI
jgi:hypothetical protein